MLDLLQKQLRAKSSYFDCTEIWQVVSKSKQNEKYSRRVWTTLITGLLNN